MADRNADVMKMVERELEKNPDASTQELYEKAVEVDSGIKELSARQFNARYPLQVKRKKAPKKPKKKRRTRGKKKSAKAAGEVDRGAVRDVLLEFARDVARAEDQAGVIDVLADLDGYVDQVAKAAGK